MRFIYGIISLCGLVSLCGQEATLSTESTGELALEESAEATLGEVEASVVETVAVELVNQSWFVDRVGMAVVYFDAEVEELESLPHGVKGLSFLNIEVQATPDSKKGQSVATLRFVLRETGLVTIPSIEFTAGERLYRSMPAQILVGAPVRSEAMAVSLTAQKRQVYVGEPLRMEFAWRCDFEAGRLQALNYYPTFFNDTAVEVVIPRNTSDEKQQVGLPLGGRRVIANRRVLPEDGKPFGTVELPLFLRWNQPGKYVIPATRLECVRLIESNRNFGQYAAHFNNALFEAEDPRVRYERYYAESAPIEIEVLPLPEEGRLPAFSGWFAPLEVEVSVKPTEVEVGQFMEVEIEVTGQAPHGMIELPALRHERSLRGRFLVDDQVGRLWRADGTRFSARVRPLSVGVEAFPSLHFQSFNPETGRYEIVTTEPVPLTVHAGDGSGFIDVSAYTGAQVSLVEQPEGIWHNLEANVMDDCMNTLVQVLADWFWFFIIIGPLGFVVLLPRVRERRRRASDPDYRERMEAYRAFQKCADKDPEKWQAFLRFMAVSFRSKQGAWTVGDSRRALQAVGASEQDIEQVVALHAAVDRQDFSAGHGSEATVDFHGLGQRIFRLINQSTLLLLLCVLGLSMFSSAAEASDWTDAEALFEQAMNAQAGSDAATALFAESALKFQAVAEAGERPGGAWYNAGNAWFKTGALGQSIAAYRQALAFRPFDRELRENLQVVRQLTLTDLPPPSRGLGLPTIWLKALVVVISLVFWLCLLLYLRYRKRSQLIATIALGLAGFTFASALAWGQLRSVREGVVVVDEVIARKGPGYGYSHAFNEALQDGLEFKLVEGRGVWSLIQLVDGRQCWIPTAQAQFILE